MSTSTWQNYLLFKNLKLYCVSKKFECFDTYLFTMKHRTGIHNEKLILRKTVKTKHKQIQNPAC